MKNLTRQNPEQLFVAQELINKVKSKCCGIKVKENFENPEFDMNLLASELGMGRSKLYTKLKEITGLTPNEFTLKLKLEEAMHLLNNAPHLNVTEISYQLGFSSARYFSKCFKTFYGIAPLNVRKNANPPAKEE